MVNLKGFTAMQQTLVYIYEYLIDGQKKSIAVLPIDAANGVIMDETFEGSGIMQGRSISGLPVKIPLEGITNFFPTWWKLWRPDGRGGVSGEYTDDEERVGNAASNDVGKSGLWDTETGEYKRAKEVEKPPQDAKRIYHKDKRPDEYKD